MDPGSSTFDIDKSSPAGVFSDSGEDDGMGQNYSRRRASTSYSLLLPKRYMEDTEYRNGRPVDLSVDQPSTAVLDDGGHADDQQKEDVKEHVLSELRINGAGGDRRRAARSSSSVLEWAEAIVGWPIRIIVGNLVLLAFAWSFLFMALEPMQIALPDEQVERMSKSPTGVIVVSTLLSTTFAAFSTYLFTRSIQYALTCRLSRPISLLFLSVGVEISRGAVKFRRHALHWTAMSFICGIALATQTAAWTTLITPTKITVVRPIIGSEISLKSSVWKPINDAVTGDNSLYFDDPKYGTERVQQSWSSLQLVVTSGISATQARSDDTVLNYRGTTYNGTTGGILRTNPLNSLDILTASPSRVALDYPKAKGFGTNFTMTQQGFSANVTCDIQKAAQPPLNMTWVQYPGHFNVSGIPTRPSSVDWVVRTQHFHCPNGKQGSNEVVAALHNTTGLFSAYCPRQRLDGTADMNTYLLAVLDTRDWTGHANTSDITVCTIHPLFTTVDVRYSSVVNVSAPLASQLVTVDTNYTTDSILTWLDGLADSAQTPSTNSIADVLTGVYLTLQGPGGADDQNTKLRLYEDFIRGAIEFTGTWVRTRNWEYVVQSGLQSNYSANMTPMNGTVTAETMGWKRKPFPSLLALVPISFVAFLSIATTIYALGISPHDERVPYTTTAREFDPLDPAHLVVASAAGGLTGAYTDFEHAGMRRNEEVKLKFGLVDRGVIRRGLVHHVDSDEKI